MRIIPAIDIIDGKCVRLTQGDYAQKKIYDEQPLEVAKMFEDAGLSYLHLVDLDGAKSSRVVNFDVLEKIVDQTHLTVDFGGGVKTREDLKRVLDLGAKQVNVGTIAIENRPLFLEWLEEFGAQKIILAADAKDEKLASLGWKNVSTLGIHEFLEDYAKSGVEYVTCTDVSKDGLLQGTSVDLYKAILKRLPDLKLIASGGVSHIKDVEELNKIGVDGVIVGKAIYEKKIDLKELVKFSA